MVQARAWSALTAGGCPLCGAIRTVRYAGGQLVHFAVAGPLPPERSQECLYCGRRTGASRLAGEWQSPLRPPREQTPAASAGAAGGRVA